MKKDKLLAKARNAPRGWTSAEVCKLLEAHGFARRTIGDELRYEHKIYSDLKMAITKQSGEIHQGYVKDSVKQIDTAMRRKKQQPQE